MTLKVPVQSGDNITICNQPTIGICSGHQNVFLASKHYHNFSQAGSPFQLVHFNILDLRNTCNVHPNITWYEKHSIVHAPTKLVYCVILVLPSYICNFYPLCQKKMCVFYYDKDSFAQPFILPCC